MTKLAQAVLACISATMMLTGAASIAGADTFTYELNDSYSPQTIAPCIRQTNAADGIRFHSSKRPQHAP